MVAPTGDAGYGNYAGAASAVAGLITQLMQGPPDNSAYKAQRDLMRRQQMYQQASVDPTHPWNKALTNQITQQLQADAARSIMADLITKQRARARGYGGALGQASRQDESRSGALAEAFMRAGITGQREASGQLAAAGGSPAGLTQNMGQYADTNMMNQMAQNKTQVNQVMTAPYVMGGLAELIQRMFSGAGVQGQQQQPLETAFSNSPWMLGMNTPYSGSTT